MFIFQTILLPIVLIAVLWGIVAGEARSTIAWPAFFSVYPAFGAFKFADTKIQIIIAMCLMSAAIAVWLAYALYALRVIMLRRRHGRSKVAMG